MQALYKYSFTLQAIVRAQEVCESRGGRPGLPVPNKPTVSVDVKQHSTNQQAIVRTSVEVNVHLRAWWICRCANVLYLRDKHCLQTDKLSLTRLCQHRRNISVMPGISCNNDRAHASLYRNKLLFDDQSSIHHTTFPAPYKPRESIKLKYRVELTSLLPASHRSAVHWDLKVDSC